jgi:hypothetical protein
VSSPDKPTALDPSALDHAVRVDGWINSLAGLGTDRDKASSWSWRRQGYYGELLLDTWADAFVGNDVVQAFAVREPDAMLAHGWEIWRVGNGREERAERIEELLDTVPLPAAEGVGAEIALHDALTWERLLGGSVVLIGADDGGSREEPLDMRSVRSLGFLTTLDRRDVLPMYGVGSNLYRLHFEGGSFTVHGSRLLVFRGRRVPRREARARQGWGVGKVERGWEEIQQFDATWMSIRHLLLDSAQGVFKMKGVVHAVGSGRGELLRDRMMLLDQTRSIARALVLDSDGDESFTREVASMAGYADILESSFQRLAQAFEGPVTVLVGTSPAGLNATGASDIRLWYDQVARERRRTAHPAVLRLAQIASVALGEDPGGIEVRWPSLWQQTDKEAADTRNAAANADRTELFAARVALSLGLLSTKEARTLWRPARGLDLDVAGPKLAIAPADPGYDPSALSVGGGGEEEPI